jgi:hypothetical protein
LSAGFRRRQVQAVVEGNAAFRTDAFWRFFVARRSRRPDLPRGKRMSYSNPKEKVMQPILATLPTLAVSATYCIWNAYRAHLQRRTKIRHERVAYLLWVMANEAE